MSDSSKNELLQICVYVHPDILDIFRSSIHTVVIEAAASHPCAR